MKQEFVDLGLPSGTLWSNRNVKLANKKHFTHYEIPLIEYITGYNVPSKEDFEELINLCKWEWINLFGGKVQGYRVTGPNGNSIFLPASGFCLYNGTSLYARGSSGYYWSTKHSSISDAYYLYFGNSSHHWYGIGYRNFRFSVRTIKHKSV